MGVCIASLNSSNLYGATTLGPLRFSAMEYCSTTTTCSRQTQVLSKSMLQGRRLDPFNRPPDYAKGDMDPPSFNDNVTAPGTGVNIDPTMNLRPLELVDVPSSIDINSVSLVAVAGHQSEVCGVILCKQDAIHDNIAVHVLGSPTASEVITAVASSDGQTVIVRTDKGNFFIGNPVPGASSFSFNFVPMSLITPPPSLGLPITKISALKGNCIFAIMQKTQLLRTFSRNSPLCSPFHPSRLCSSALHLESSNRRMTATHGPTSRLAFQPSLT